MTPRLALAVVGLTGLILGIAALSIWRCFDRDIKLASARVAHGSTLIATRCGPIEYQDAGTGVPLLAAHGSGGGYDQGMAFAGALAHRGIWVIAMSRFGYRRVEAALREAVVDWRFYPAVLGLQAMRGVQFTTAVGMLAELGDLSRFEHPRQLMAWLGVTPSEHSSGDRRRQGSITKNGNSYARKLLNITVVAVARELTGFIWDIGRLAMSLAIPRAAQAT